MCRACCCGCVRALGNTLGHVVLLAGRVLIVEKDGLAMQACGVFNQELLVLIIVFVQVKLMLKTRLISFNGRNFSGHVR